MTPKKLLEIMTILMPYIEHGDNIGAEHDEIWITYTGILPKPICEFLAAEGVYFGERRRVLTYSDYEENNLTYEEYVEDKSNQRYISFYG